MEFFHIIESDNIVFVKVDLLAASNREAKPLWDTFEKYSMFDGSKIVIDLSSCSHIDSTFIGMIVRIFKKVSESNGGLKLVFPQLSLIDSFRVLGISKILMCYNSPEEAYSAFKSEAQEKSYLFSDEIINS